MSAEYTPEQLDLATTARSEWDNYKELKEVKSDYETQKGITRMGSAKTVYLEEGMKSVFNLTGVNGNCLIIPLYNTEGRFMAMQCLLPNKVERSDGATNKLFPANGAMMRSYYSRHKIEPNGEVYLCEGYATGASVRDAKNDWNVIVCLCCANIPKVAGDLRAKYPYLKINYIADNDLFTDGNPGLTAAKAAVKITGTKYGGKIYTPAFYPPKDKSTTDFNDMAREHGIEEVKSYLSMPGINIQEDFRLQPLKNWALAEDANFDWLVEKLMVCGGTSCVAALAKTGKSTLMRYLAYCVATGSPFLGYQTKKVPVVYLSLDEPDSVTKRGWRKIASAVNGELPKNIWIFNRKQRLPKLEDRIEYARKLCAEYKPGLMIIDTFARFHPFDDSNKDTDIHKILGPLFEIAAQFNTHICILWHFKKTSGEKKPSEINALDIRGSAAIFECVDTAILMGKFGERRWLKSFGRLDSDIESTFLGYNSSTGFFSLQDSTEESEANSEDHPGGRKTDSFYDEKILAAIPSDGWVSQKHIREVTHLNGMRLGSALARLCDAKILSDRLSMSDKRGREYSRYPNPQQRSF